MTTMEDDDLAAMERLVAGEDRALTEIMDRWKTRLISYLYRFTGNESVAVDLAQETFVRLYQARAKFRPTASSRCFSTWLFGIAANLARQHHRWQGRHPTLPLEAAEESTTLGDPAQSAETREQSNVVKSAIAALPNDLREALILSEYEDLSHAQIAKIASCSVKAVERRISHAREQLRRQLSKYFL